MTPGETEDGKPPEMVAYGDIRLRRQKEGLMIIFRQYRENPNAPIIPVTGLGGMFQMGSDILATVINEIPNSAGVADAFAAAHLLWPASAWMSAVYLSRYAQQQFRKGEMGARHIFTRN